MSAGSSSSSKAEPREDIGKRLALLAFLLFACTSSRFPFPDESAALLAQHLHLMPFRPMSHPLWGWMVQALAALHIGPASFLPNLFSAACGAGCVRLMYQLAGRLSFQAGHEKLVSSTRTLSAGCAALYLMVAVPFWMESNRAHPGSFDLLLLLGALRLLCHFRDTGDRRLTYGIPALLSIGAAESATILWCSPALGLYYLLLLRLHRQLTLPLIRRSLLAGIPGALIYVVFAWLYARAAVAGWREFSGVGQSLWYVLLEQWAMIKNGVPRQGWLLLFFATFLPWACCAWMLRESQEASRRLGLAALFTVITGLAVAILFNARFAPWRLTGTSPLLVTPYVMIAAYFGYVVGFWHCCADSLARRRPGSRSSFTTLVTLAAAALLAFAGWRNYSFANARGVKQMHGLAREMAGQMAGRRILLTDGLADAPLLLAARDAGVKMDVVNARLTGSLPYRRYAASLTDAPRLQALARIGFLPFLMQWLKTETNVADRLAFQMSPDYWLSTGHDIVPNGSLYLGLSAGATPDLDKLLHDQRAFWKKAGPQLAAIKMGAPPLKKLGDAAGRHISSVANDLGVLLENDGQPAGAQEAYRAAVALAPKNLSAYLNLQQLLLSAAANDEAARAGAEAERLAKEVRLPLKSLVEMYGHVRTKEALARLQEMWNRTAAPAAPAAPALQEALELAQRGENKAAREKLEKLLRDRSGPDQAWILLATLAHAEGDRATLTRCLEHMRSEEKQWPQVLVMVGEDALKRNDPVAARMYFEKAAFLWPENTEVMEMLVKLDLMEKKLESLPGRLDVLLTLDPKNAIGNFALGSILFGDHEYELAEQAYRTALEGEAYPPALNNLAWLLQMQGKLEEALERARAATQADPTSYNAWDTLGVVQMKRGELAESESALKMAQAIDADMPDARIHLAQLLSKRGHADEASAAAKAVLAEYPTLSEELRQQARAILK